MRFVSWNCCGGLASDWPAVRALGTDVAVLSEVPSAALPPSLFERTPSWTWVGDLAYKGLAIAGLTSDLEARLAEPTTGRWSLAAQHESGIGVLGIWTCPPKGRPYGAEALAAIEAHMDWLTSTPCIIAGDFNVSPFGTEDNRTGILRRLFARLGDIGYSSIYHHVTRESFGSELRATYFHRRKLSEPFHIDYCFIRHDLVDQVQDFRLGTFDEWVAKRGAAPGHSDHVPLILDLDV